MAESTGGDATPARAPRKSSRRTARKRTTTKRTTAAKPAAKRAAPKATTAKRRGRPPGSATRRTADSAAAALTSRVQALIDENQRLKAQVRDLEAAWAKIEKALSGGVTRAKRAVRKRAKKVTRQVERAIDQVTR
jgi:hypothetical protein